MGHPVTDMYVWVVDDPDHTHGIPAKMLPGIGAVPMLSSQRHLALAMRNDAQEVARQTGLNVELRHFARYEIIDAVSPDDSEA